MDKKRKNEMEHIEQKRSARAKPTNRSSSSSSSNLLVALQASHDPVMVRIYSFLATKDRLRLRKVSRAFWIDMLLCQSMVGVYGAQNFEVQEAFEQVVRPYMEFLGTPDSLIIDEGIPECWPLDLFGECPRIAGRRLHALVVGRYDDNSGYYNFQDLQDQADAAGRGDELDEEDDLSYYYYLRAKIEFYYGGDELSRLRYTLARVNSFRRETRESLEEVSAEIIGTPGAPYNFLFDLLEEHDIDIEPFLYARYGHDREGSLDHGYEIIQRDENGNSTSKYLEHLRSGLKLVYRDVNGAITEKILKKCETCKEIRNDVQTEFCGKTHYRGFNCSMDRRSVCRDCTTKTMCGSCGETHCNLFACFNFVTCCVPGCDNKMCSRYCKSYEYLFDDSIRYGNRNWDGQSCMYFMLPPGAENNEAFRFSAALYESQDPKFYCLEHKPNGAIPVPPLEVDEDDWLRDFLRNRP